MTSRPRRNHSPAFQANVAVGAIKGEKALIELALQIDVLSGALGRAGLLPRAKR